MDAAKSEKNVTKAVLKANNLMNDVQANQLMEHINNVVKPNVKYLGIDTLQNEHLVDNALNACGGAFQLEADSEDTTDNEKTCDNVWGLMDKVVTRMRCLPMLKTMIFQTVQQERDRCVRVVVRAFEGEFACF